MRGSAAATEGRGLPVAVATGSLGMDALRELLEELRRQDATRQYFLGLLHLLVGRRITRADGTVVSNGMTWRELAALLKRLRWDKSFVAGLGLNSADLPPRDRERYWYSVIARAGVDATKAKEQADRVAEILRSKGFVVSAGAGK